MKIIKIGTLGMGINRVGGFGAWFFEFSLLFFQFCLGLLNK
jgi:hypothetical protein